MKSNNVLDVERLKICLCFKDEKGMYVVNVGINNHIKKQDQESYNISYLLMISRKMGALSVVTTNAWLHLIGII